MPLKAGIVGIAVFVVSWAGVTVTPSPWDLGLLVIGVACMPLWLGIRAFGGGARQLYRGPARAQAAAATVLGLALVLVSGRALLAIYGWH